MLLSNAINRFLVFYFNKTEKCHHIYKYLNDAQLIKSGHIPQMGFRLLSGAVVVYCDNKFIGEYGAPSCWGTRDIVMDKNAHYCVYIKKDSTVCALGKTELKKSWMKFLNFFEKDMLDGL